MLQIFAQRKEKILENILYKSVKLFYCDTGYRIHKIKKEKIQNVSLKLKIKWFQLSHNYN